MFLVALPNFGENKIKEVGDYQETLDSSPMPSVISEENQPVATPTPVSNETLVFDENFEDKNAQFDIWAGEDGKAIWEIRADETGNMVYELDYSDGWSYPKAYFGGQRWDNYRIKFQLQFLDYELRSTAGCLFMHNNEDGNYAVDIKPNNDTVHITYWDDKTETHYVLKSEKIQLGINEWITIQVDVIDRQISVFVDGNFIGTMPADRNNKIGGIGLQVHPNTNVQFDNVQVYVLGQ